MAYAKAIDTAPVAVAAADSSAAVTPAGDPPISYIVAIWLGTSHEDIERGLREGWISPPPGAPSDWQPPWVSASDASTPPPDPGTGGAVDGGAGVNRSKVSSWFHALDPSLSASGFDSIWTHSGGDDSARASALFGYLQRALLGTSGAAPACEVFAANGGGAAVAALDTFLGDSSHHAQVVELTGKSGAALEALAKTDIGYRYALKNLDSIALTGNRAMFAAHGEDGALDRFDPDTGEQNLSDAWLGDRAKFLAWKMKADGGGDLAIPGTDQWVFSDRSVRDANGDPMRLEIAASDGATRTNQVIFGQDLIGGETIKGDTGTDRIYGGSGDDVIRGNAGDDHLEGGRGDDIVRGGNGDDEVIGGRGDDELLGGSGNDALDGGSGDDTLTGGKGDDRLAGGEGHDSYMIDPGQGADAIIDSDGRGEIEFDGDVLDGGLARADGKFQSGDGRAVYSFSGDGKSLGTLSIELFDATDPGRSDAPVDTLSIENWKNGDLGIYLQPGAVTNAIPDESTPASADMSSVAPDNMAGADSSGTDATAPVDSSSPLATMTPEWNTPNHASPLDAFEPPTESANGRGYALSPGGPGDSARPMSPLTADVMQRAITAFAGVPEAPDVTLGVSAADAPFAAITPYDVSSAMLDFHDTVDVGHEVGVEHAPMPAPILGSELHTTGSSTSGPAGVDKAAKGIGRIV